jgi:hypothetical protein
MKNILKLTMVTLLVQLAACREDAAPSAREIKLDLLASSTWGNAQVIHATDGNLSSEYAEFAIAFTKGSTNGFDGTFIISNGGNAFSEGSGRWKFSVDLRKIILDSGKDITFEVDDEHLTLDFVVPPPPNGRIDGLSGHFTFDLKPI